MKGWQSGPLVARDVGEADLEGSLKGMWVESMVVQTGRQPRRAEQDLRAVTYLEGKGPATNTSILTL